MHQWSAKDALFDALAEAAKALASGRRAEIVDVLAQGERSVEDIAAQIDQSVPNTSNHLRVMARAGMLHTRREGTRIVYMLASDRVAELWAALQAVAAEHVPDVQRLAEAYVGDPDGRHRLQPCQHPVWERSWRRLGMGTRSPTTCSTRHLRSRTSMAAICTL